MLKPLKRLLARWTSVVASPHDANPPARGESARSGLPAGAEQFASFVHGVGACAIFLLDRDGVIRTWNDGAQRLHGYPPEEIVGQHCSRLYPASAFESGQPAQELHAAAQSGRTEVEDWRLRRDGSQFRANVVIAALRNDSGEVCGFLEITCELPATRGEEERLRRSEERFRLLTSDVKDYAIFMLDQQGCVATWNPGAQRLKGYTTEEVLGRHFSCFYPQEAVDRGWPEEELRRATAEGRFEDEGWRVRKDGSQFWANVVITALRDGDGQLLGFGKITRDLTERRRAEESNRRLLEAEAARRASETAAVEIERQREQLRVTLSSIGDGVIVTDANARVTFINPVAADLTGWPLDEALGRPLEEVFQVLNEETREPVENPAQQVLREGVVVGLGNHTILISRDGREIPIDDSGAPICGEQSASGGGVVLVFRDVTDARRAVEARLRLAAIVDSSDDAIIGIDLDGLITSWNAGAERLFDYTARELIGTSISTLAPAGHSDEVPGILERIRRGERIEHFETRRQCKDGDIVDVSLTISPVLNSSGKVVGASKIARDITARKAEERRRSEFIAVLAHELRNPLAPIRSGIQIFRNAGDDRDAMVQASSIMERQIQHLVRLVDDLLDVSRISRGTLQLRRAGTTLRDVINHALEICGTVCDDNPLTVALPDEAIPLYVDKTRLAQALCNLLNNAVKYSEPHSPVWLTGRQEGSEVVISVRDEGIGIPRHMLQKVFELFTQVDRSREEAQTGLGIGLTVVKQLVEMHGGRVEAHSEGIGQGSEFVIRLPVGPAAPEARPTHQAPATTRPAPRRKILVVDDNVDGARALAMMLRFKGNEVHTANDALGAIHEAATFRPEIILLDIGMPKIDGYETCRRIREQSAGRDVVIVALTGWGLEDDRRRSLEAGFDDHLVKPIDPAVLDQLLSELKPRGA